MRRFWSATRSGRKRLCFFDDLPQNLEAARRFGLSTVLVTGYESIVEGLRSFGIEIE